MTHAELAEYIGVKPRQLSNLKNKPDYPKDGTPDQVKAWYEARNLERESSNDDLRELKAKLTEEQGKLTEAKRKLAELELEREREGLIPIAEAKKIIQDTLAPLRTHLDALPSRFAHQLNPADPALAADVLRDALNEAYELMQRGLDSESK